MGNFHQFKRDLVEIVLFVFAHVKRLDFFLVSGRRVAVRDYSYTDLADFPQAVFIPTATLSIYCPPPSSD